MTSPSEAMSEHDTRVHEWARLLGDDLPEEFADGSRQVRREPSG